MRALVVACSVVGAVLGGCAGHQVDLGRQAPATLGGEPRGAERALVTRVIDGDTIEVTITARSEGPGAGETLVGRSYDVRLIGVDTPETVRPGTPVECFGKEASAAAEALLEGKEVSLVTDVENVDGYDRLLRYVYLEAEMANARLVVNGYATVYTYPPNVRHSDLFVSLQREARAEQRGLWSSSTCDGETG
jgi:micrococcal nuclease